MEYIAVTDKDVAESIAAEIRKATGTDCEAYHKGGASVIVYDRTTVIARVITELFPAIAVVPLCGPFASVITDIPPAVRTFNDMKKAARALDIATSHTLNAALNH